MAEGALRQRRGEPQKNGYPIMVTIKGSYMEAGDVASYWPEYHDTYIPVQLGAAPGESLVIARAEHLLDYLAAPTSLAEARPWSLFPPLLGVGVPEVVNVPAVMTGGRTFLLTEQACELLGIPARIELDLDRLGWGSGRLECRPEVKGAGTLFSRTLLRVRELERVVSAYPLLAKHYADLSKDVGHPIILSSCAMYLKRILGGQDAVYGSHAIKVSESMFETSGIKFAPVWLVSRFPDNVCHNLKIISSALSPEVQLSDRSHVNLVRFTPGTVRARYFDTASSDTELKRLARRVSQDVDELWQTWHEMVADARRYIDDVAATTVYTEQGFRWAKVGDINEVFKTNHLGEFDRAFEYRHRRREAWFLSKDEVVVRRIGKVFVDLESLWAGATRFTSADEPSLRFHHELVLLMVLRDHIRVCTAFRIAISLIERGWVSPERRRRHQQETIAALMRNINASELIECAARPGEFLIRLRYPQMAHWQTFRIPRWQVREPYPP